MDISEVTIPNKGGVVGPMCVPDYCQVNDDPVASYRRFYIHGKDWSMSWSNRKVPKWYTPAGKVNNIPTQVEE